MNKSLICITACAVITLNTVQAHAENASLQTRVAWLPECVSEQESVLEPNANRSAVLGAIAIAIGGKLIEGAVDSAAEALKAAGETKTVATTAKSESDFYEITSNADLKVKSTCLVVVRGEFDNSKESSEKEAWASEYEAFKGLQNSTFRMEAKLKPLSGLKYFQLVPRYLRVTKFEETGFFRPNHRDYIVAVSLTVPGGAQPFGSAELVFKNVVRDEKPLDHNAWQLRAASSMPIAYPPESTDATKAKTKREAELAPLLLAQDILETPEENLFTDVPSVFKDDTVKKKVRLVCDAIDVENRRLNNDNQITDSRCAYRVLLAKGELDSALESAHRNVDRKRWAEETCTLDPDYEETDGTATKCIQEPPFDSKMVGKSFTYFTTQLTLSETSEGSKFAKFLGTALGAAKSDVSSALQSKLLPKSQAQKDSEETEARTARTSVMVADLEVTKAEEALADALSKDPLVPVDITSARIALLKAKIAANDGYRKANLPVPYPEIGG
jgi:hypothetical protein